MRLRFPSGFSKTLGFRLTLWYAAIFIASSVILFAVSYMFLHVSVRDNRREVESKLKKYVTLYERGGIAALRQAADDPRNSFFVRIVGPGNKTVFLSNPALWEKFDVQPRQDQPAEGQWQYFPAKSKTDADVLELTSVDLRGGFVVQVGKDIEDRQEILEDFRETTLAVMIPIILIGLAGGAILAARATRPIRRLIETTQSIVDTGRMDARVPMGKSDDELDQLVGLFNRMLGRIEGLIKGMRGALDNVAHDLRTPITRLRGIAEMALRSDGQRPQDCREVLADCLEESERVATLLNTLMDISEAETGTMNLRLEPLDVSSLIEEIVELYDHVAEDKEITVSVDCPNDITMIADLNRMRQVFANLLDNAIKYSGPKTSVAIDADERNGQIVIRVRDHGSGIPPGEISKIWDRLHRGDASRSQPGLGLGLSLVQAVVRAHQGRVGVQSQPGVGSAFTLYLPSASLPAQRISPAPNLSEM
jgi:signal transduction histidine kinase